MKANIVTTNLRMDRDAYLQIKAMASEDGKSFNKYLNSFINKWAMGKILYGEGVLKAIRNKKFRLSDFPYVKVKDKPMGLSEDDKLIYE
ncbi:hypothetical protein KKE45_03380 [Patescibacteria group bacterium]|nr:hypothetical protein [Patescibacteria group bacterium]